MPANDRRRRAIGPEAVDRAFIAALPEQAAEPHGGPDEDEVVELVEIPFVVAGRRRAAGTGRRSGPGCSGRGYRRARRSRGRSASPPWPTASPRAGPRASRGIRCASKAMLPAQKCTPSSAPMNASWKTKPASDRADRQHGQRHQHRPRALVRMIAAGAGRKHAPRSMSVSRLVIRAFGARIVMLAVERVLDMLGLPPSAPCRRRSGRRAASE